ncbi:GNAT family N-acetyltransferase [Alkaliphilus hydrothermalis]|uniref:RimJ/RimL family protein N-acetyltransferase n=1 Tax=Alkaliphilus hydrothermalis TaxID=1482730 RepID=A0ABS2NNP2_9FIRM|nr:GNAT family N-acetyltransferase [Alkaliphilus hydrothermalis]MBM7614199.1 RimJ/RimL family protein N-acetyltransferase [Alkaliphilus hydrothermalis]
MIELEKKDFQHVKSLLNEENHHFPLLKSVISHNIEGRIFVDELNPQKGCQSALIINNMGWAYFLGREDNDDFNEHVEEILKSFASMTGNLANNNPIIWFGISDYWRGRVTERLTTDVQDYPRMQYIFNPEGYQFGGYTKDDTNFHYEIAEITEENIQQAIAFNESIINFWQSKEEFLKKGFGYIVLDREKIISQSISASVEDGEVEIDILTEQDYRGKGLAKIIASRLIEKCLGEGLIPKWDCIVNNTPSRKLAEQLGFEVKKEYNLSIINL